MEQEGGMTITEHKRLIAANPEDLRNGDAIELSCDGEEWFPEIFSEYGAYGQIYGSGEVWRCVAARYCRRPAQKEKQ